MKNIDLDNITQQNERILYLLAELNSALDLYYENRIENEIYSSEK